MKRVLLLIGFVLANALQLSAQDLNFNEGWRFLNEKVEGAESPEYDDSEWREVTLPHDWAIEGPFDVKYNARAGGLPFHGTGWYRKEFTLPKGARDKVIRLEFEGAMYNAHVYINGKFVGNRPYGYIGFEYDISQYLNFGEGTNVVAVRLSPEDLSSRWYPGAGIYRSVWLKMDEKIHVDHWGTYITTPTVGPKKAVVQNETVIINRFSEDKTIVVKQEYFAPSGNKVAEGEEELLVKAGTEQTSALFVTIENPAIWGLENPHLYTQETSLWSEGKEMDRYSTKFGIREIAFDKDGFYLNGEKLRFQGVCLHHDNGPLGAAVNRRAIQRKLQIMKDMGVNAVRTSHNPPSRELLELCDEMGILVQDEAFDVWKLAKVPNGYNKFFEEWSEIDLADMIRRDRNHPSVVMWSIGNEILEQGKKEIGWKLAKQLHEVCVQMDPSRPTTAGFNYYSAPYDNNMAQQVDIAGMNYKPSMYSEVRKNYPYLPTYGSETSSVTSSRGVYHLPIEKYSTHESLQVTSYDIIGPPWAYPPDIEFYFQEQNPHSMGEFMWTGFDYLGEPTPYGGKDNSTNGYWNADWPARSSYFGAVDLSGFPKDRFYLYQSQWTSKPMIHVLPHWNWEGMEGQEIPVYCYTNCDEVELFVNGKSMGRKVKGKDKTNIIVDFLRYEPKSFDSPYRLSWMVPYEAGNIKVIGYKNGEKINEKSIFTAGKPYQLALEVDRERILADGVDLAYITVKVLDKEGNVCPLADNKVSFIVEGVGRLEAVGNGDPTSTASFQADNRKAFNGLCLAILKASKEKGEISLTAQSKGLKKASISIISE